MIKTCVGCGVRLQTIDKKQRGYVPEESLDKGYCMRCFRLTHYHDFKNAYYPVHPKDILTKLKKKKGICFFLCDFMNFNEEAFSYYHQISLKKYFVVSKADLIPKSISYEKLKIWLRKEGNILEEIFFVSQKQQRGIRKLQDMIQEIQEPIYFMGMTNSGKSSLLNTLFNFEKKLTVSEMPNTTLDFIQLPCSGMDVYDTAGFPYSYFLSDSFMKDCAVSKELTPIVMPLKKDASLVIWDLIRFQVSNQNTVTCFFAPKLKPKKMYPNQPLYMDEEPLQYELLDDTLFILKGIGMFSVKNACKVTLYHGSKEMISIMPSFLKK